MTTPDNMPIRADVPPSLHPDVLLAHTEVLDKPDTPGPAAIAAGREALAAMYRIYGAMEDAEKALQAAAAPGKRRQHYDGRSEYLGDLRMTTGHGIRRFHGAEAEFAEAASTAYQRASLTVDRRVKELTGYAEALTKQVAHALDDPNRKTPEGLALAGEVRAHVKGLSKQQRYSFVMDAIERGDRATVAAVLHGQPFLSGLEADQLEAVRQAAAAKFAPVASAQLAATNKIVDTVTTAGGAFLTRYQKALAYKDSPASTARRKLSQLGEAR